MLSVVREDFSSSDFAGRLILGKFLLGNFSAQDEKENKQVHAPKQ
jgi:hypothetical protein